MDKANLYLPKPKFINSTEDCVREALEGICLLDSNVRLLSHSNVLIQKKVSEDKVAIICGGGSGHEPAHANFVTKGLLTGAVCGGVFSSPSYKDVFDCIKACGKSKGVLLVIKNYTGDVLNFELAANIAKSYNITVSTLRVQDDIALGKLSNARGIAGTILFYKILGAAAEAGKSLEEIVELGEKLQQSLCSLGISLSACALPGSPAMFKLGENEMELGMGIHGEKGKERMKVTNSNQIVNTMLDQLLTYMKSSKVVLGINNLGATSEIEMMVTARAVLVELRDRNITVERVIYGRFMTSLDMHGVSLTVLDFGDYHLDDQKAIVEGLDLPISSNCYFKVVSPNEEDFVISSEKIPTRDSAMNLTQKDNDPRSAIFRTVLSNMCEKLTNQESYLNGLDADVGDGDIGFGAARSTKAILEQLENLPLAEKVADSLKIIAELIAESFGGSSGPLYGALLIKGAYALPDKSIDKLELEDWATAFKTGVDGLKDIGMVDIGDRTMLDALLPAAEAALANAHKGLGEMLKSVVKAAREGADKVKGLVGKKGRSAYLGERVIGLPDPGCELAYMWLLSIKDTLLKKK